MAASRPRLPTGTRAYVIGDIHGRADLLSPLLERIDADLQERPVPYPVEIFLGDYIDRGPNSREVIDRLIARSCVRETIFLRGNHETYLSAFLDQPAIFSEWRQIGGLETLMSYGMQPSLRMEADEQIRLAAAFQRVLPESHRLFLDSLSTSLSAGDYFFVHAGIRPGIPFAKQRDEDLLWIRRGFSPLRGELRQGRCPRALARAGTRNPPQPDQHRHRGLCNWAIDLSGLRRRKNALPLSSEQVVEELSRVRKLNRRHCVCSRS